MGKKKPGLIERAIRAYAWRLGANAPHGPRINDCDFTKAAIDALIERLLPEPDPSSMCDEMLVRAFVAHVMVNDGMYTYTPEATFDVYVRQDGSPVYDEQKQEALNEMQTLVFLCVGREAVMLMTLDLMNELYLL